MKSKNFRPKHGPEYFIQRDIIAMLRNKGWYVVRIPGGSYLSGMPDLYASHSKYGIRWIEVKQPLQYDFTSAQLDRFPKLSANGTRIWILVAATEAEYQKLFKEPNWVYYLHWERL